MKYVILYFALIITFATTLFAQTAPMLFPSQGGFPWQKNLNICWSTDGGNTFGAATKFLDSAGVPTAIKTATGLILTAFQWFPAPQSSPNWDKIGVRFSDDNGVTWLPAQAAVFTGIPSGFQRPFDPTLTLLEDGRIRMFFSCGPTPKMMIDSNVATYSAISSDGVNYTFESGIRFKSGTKGVVDPAVLRIGKKWYYTAPVGPPQDGAYFATSDDGVNFTQKSTIPSDRQHLWTGNLVEYGAGMRFYGYGSNGVFYSYSLDGTSWTTMTDIANVRGGDPAVLRTTDNTYFLIYVTDVVTTSTMTTVQAPTLLQPADKAVNTPLFTALEWSAVAGATFYDLHIAGDSGFFTTVQRDSMIAPNITRRTVGEIFPGTTLYWRMRTKSGSGTSTVTSPWSPARSFTAQRMTSVRQTVRAENILSVSPNPVQDVVRVQFTLSKVERVQLRLYDVLGREIAHLLDADLPAGEHDVEFAVRHSASGIVFLRLHTASGYQTQIVRVLQ